MTDDSIEYFESRETNGESPSDHLSPPTSMDVARLANVSRATVSYVLNGTSDTRISEATKNRVIQAASQLGYIPHKNASSLRSGRSDLVMLPFFDWPYNQSSLTFLKELALSLDNLGYTVMLRFFKQGERKLVARKIAASHPIGVIVGPDELSESDVELLARNGVKTILAYEGPSYPYLPSIAPDFTVIGEKIGEYLITRGSKRIAVIVPQDLRIQQIGLQRLQGIENIASQYNVKVERFDMSMDPGEAALLALRWKQGSHPDAVFTYNDEFGVLLLSALQDVGLQIPRQIALIGCDDLSLCEMVRPRLTSVNIAPETAARSTAHYFHLLIQGQGEKIPPLLQINCSIVIRESG